VACCWEREWVVSGGVCFWVASARAGVGLCSWGRGVLAPPRSMVRVSGLVTRWRTSIPSTCDVTCARDRDGSRVSVYGRTTFSTRDPGGAEITEYYKTSQGFVMCDNFL
jgi:hypothetical protein